MAPASKHENVPRFDKMPTVTLSPILTYGPSCTTSRKVTLLRTFDAKPMTTDWPSVLFDPMTLLNWMLLDAPTVVLAFTCVL